MGFGERVRITRPPVGKKQWEDQLATVVTLIPIAKHPLDYTLRLDGDGGEEHNVSADCLEPIAIEEERQEGLMSYCIVNGLMYCSDHRLEVCGCCGVDHRITNYQMEINATDEDDFEVVDRLLEGMRRIGAPSRQAPTKKSRSRLPLANKAPFHPVVNDGLLIIPGGFDPSSCETWPQELPTELALRMATAFGESEPGIPEFAKLPLRRVRENVVCAGRMWDQFLSSRSANEPMVRLILQDEAQTQALTMDLVLPIRSLRIAQSVIPFFVVRWGLGQASSMEDAMAIMGTMERDTKMGEIPVEVDEIELMVALLKKNSERLDRSFVRSVEKHPHVLSVSVLTPISEAAQIAFYENLGPYCYQCGTSDGIAVMKCSRCVQVTYCSKECQKKNWRFHKLSCQPAAETV